MPTAPALHLSKLNRAEQDVFLLQHVPHRLCAASTWLKLPHKWVMPKEPALPNNHFHVWCTGRSVDEGRYAAMRWLTEFVGVKMAWVGRRGVRPKVPKDRPDQMVTIRRFNGGRFFPLGTRHSALLARIWKGCTQASVHPTRDTNHPDVSEGTLAKGLTLILDHLDAHLYRPNHLHLWNVLRTQEQRSNIRRLNRRTWVHRYKAELAKLPPA
jgi:hypothetical protein